MWLTISILDQINVIDHYELCFVLLYNDLIHQIFGYFDATWICAFILLVFNFETEVVNLVEIYRFGIFVVPISDFRIVYNM